MSENDYRRLSLVSALVMAVLGASSVATAATVKVSEPLELKMATGQAFFFLSAVSGELANVEVVLRRLEASNGKVLATSLLKIEGSPFKKVTPEGTDVLLTAQPGSLDYGKYQIILVIKADGVEAKAVSGTLELPQPTISTPSLQGATILLYRGWFAGPASGEREWELLAAPSCLRNSRVSVTVSNADTAMFGEPGPITSGPSLGPDCLLQKLTLKDFRHTGKFKASVTVATANMVKQAEAAFTVIVTDQPLLPGFAIALGVLLALITNYFAHRFKPRAQVQLRILEFSSTLQSFRERTQDPNRLKDIEHLEFRLRQVSLLIEDGSFESARTELQVISAELLKLDKDLQDDRTKAFEELDRVFEELAKAGSTPEANQLREQFEGIAELVLVWPYETIQAELRKLSTAAENMNSEGKSKEQKVEIKVNDPPSARVQNRPIHFSIEGPEDKLAGRSIEWDFGDGSHQPNQKRSLTHRFRLPGTFEVKVALRGNENDEPIEATLTIVVTPHTESREIVKIRSLLARSEWGILGISAVLAVTSGLWVLYSGDPFGSVAQYCEAILWGFGIDNTVRGFSSVLSKVQA